MKEGPAQQFTVSYMWASGLQLSGMCVQTYVLKNPFYDESPLENCYDTWWQGRWDELQLFY